MAAHSSNHNTSDSPITQDGDAGKFDASVASFLTACEISLRDAQNKAAKQAPRITRFTLGLISSVAALTSLSAFFLLENGATLLQIALTSIGEVFLLSMVAMSGLVDAFGIRGRESKHDLDSELDRYKELGIALGRLSRLRSQWSRSVIESESALSELQERIDRAESELQSLTGAQEAMKLEIIKANDDRTLADQQLNLIQDAIHQKSNERDRIEAEVSSVSSQLDSAREQLAALNVSVDAERVRLESINEESQVASASLAAIEKDRHAAIDALGQLTQQQSEVQESLEKLRSDANELIAVEAMLTQRRQENEATARQNERLVVDRQQATTELDQLKSLITKCTAELTGSNAELERVQLDVKVSEESREALRTEISNQRKELETLGLQVAQLQQEVSELAKSKEQLLGDILDHDFKIITAKKEIERLEHQRANLTEISNENERISRRIEEQRLAYDTALAKVKECESTIAVQLERISALSDEIRSGESQLLVLTDAADDKSIEVNKLAAVLAELQNDVQQIHEVRDSQIARNQIAVEKLEQQRLEIDSAEQRIVELNQQIACLNEAHDGITQENTTLADQRARLVDSIEGLKQDSVKYRSEQAAVEIERQAVAKAYDELHIRRREVEAELQELSLHFDQVKEQVEVIQSEIEDSRNENGRLQMKAVALKSQESALRGEIADLGVVREQTDAEVTKAQSLLQDLKDQADQVRESLRSRDAIRLQILKLNEDKELLANEAVVKNNELLALQVQVDAANEILIGHPERIAQFESEITSKSNSLLELENSIAEKADSLEQLAADVDLQRANHDSLQVENNRLDEQAQELKRFIQELKAQSEQLDIERQEYQRFSQLRVDAENQLMNVRYEIEEATIRMDEIKNAIVSGDEVIKSNMLETQNAEVRLARLNQELTDCQAVIDEVGKRRFEIESDVERFAMKAEELQSTVKDLEDEVARLEILKSQGEVLRQANGKLESELLAKQQQIQQAELRLDDLIAKGNDLTHDNEKMGVNRESKEAELHALIQKTEFETERLSAIESQQQAIEQLILKSESRRLACDSEVRSLEEAIEHATLQKLQIGSEIDELKGEVEKWQSAAADAERGRQELETIRVDRESLISSVELAKSSLIQAEQSLDDLVGIRANAEQDLQSIVNEIDTNRKIVADIQFSARSLVDEVERLNRSKQSLESELIQFEEALQLKQREISAIESKDLQRQSIAIRELEEAALQLSETERRLATAKESLRAQEENVNEALSVSKQWDSYIASLRTKCEELQQTSLKSNQELQATLAEKLRAEEELLSTKRQITESTNRSETMRVELSRLEGEVAASSERKSAIESSILELQKSEQRVRETVKEQTTQIDVQNERVRSIEQEISTKNRHLTELAIAEGRLIERCEAIEQSIRNATAESRRLEEQASSQRVDTAVAIVVPAANSTIQASPENGSASEEDLLDKIESLVEGLDRSQTVPRDSKREASDRGIDAGTSSESAMSETLLQDTRSTKRPLERKETPPDPWASVFG